MSARQMRTILADLDRMAEVFDLDRHGLGDHALDVAADGVRRCFLLEQDPDGTPWHGLSPAYEAEKARLFPGLDIGVRLALMSADDQVRGVRAVTAHRATMTYGTDPLARDEAEWFQDPAGAQPPRPFYAIHVDAVPELDRHFDARFVAVMGP